MASKREMDFFSLPGPKDQANATLVMWELGMSETDISTGLSEIRAECHVERPLDAHDRERVANIRCVLSHNPNLTLLKLIHCMLIHACYYRIKCAVGTPKRHRNCCLTVSIYINLFFVVCRRQELIAAPFLPRNCELRNLKLGCFKVHRNEYVKPFVLDYVFVMVHMAKSNKKGELEDNRGIAHHRNTLEDPLFLFAIHCACRLFMHSGRPLQETCLDSDSWYSPYHLTSIPI